MPINQVYNSMQTGLIDGVITGSSVLKDFKIAEVTGSITTGANLGRLAFFAVMGQGLMMRCQMKKKRPWMPPAASACPKVPRKPGARRLSPRWKKRALPMALPSLI